MSKCKCGNCFCPLRPFAVLWYYKDKPNKKWKVKQYATSALKAGHIIQKTFNYPIIIVDVKQMKCKEEPANISSWSLKVLN